MDILILILATWRLSSLLARERGPYNMLGIFRHFSGIRFDDLGQKYFTNEFAEGLDCVWCNSVWVGFTLIILRKILPDKVYRFVIFPLALSAGAIIIKEAIDKWQEPVL